MTNILRWLLRLFAVDLVGVLSWALFKIADGAEAVGRWSGPSAMNLYALARRNHRKLM